MTWFYCDFTMNHNLCLVSSVFLSGLTENVITITNGPKTIFTHFKNVLSIFLCLFLSILTALIFSSCLWTKRWTLLQTWWLVRFRTAWVKVHQTSLYVCTFTPFFWFVTTATFVQTLADEIPQNYLKLHLKFLSNCHFFHSSKTFWVDFCNTHHLRCVLI